MTRKMEDHERKKMISVRLPPETYEAVRDAANTSDGITGWVTDAIQLKLRVSAENG